MIALISAWFLNVKEMNFPAAVMWAQRLCGPDIWEVTIVSIVPEKLFVKYRLGLSPAKQHARFIRNMRIAGYEVESFRSGELLSYTDRYVSFKKMENK